MPRLPKKHPEGKEPTPKTKYKFEEAVEKYLDNSDVRERALKFGEWLRANKFGPSSAPTGYNWYINITGSHVCHIRLYDGDWHIWPFHNIQRDIVENTDIKDKILDSAFYCFKCSHSDGCLPRTTIKLHGKDIENVCMHTKISIRNPDDKILNVIKESLLTRRAAELAKRKA